MNRRVIVTQRDVDAGATTYLEDAGCEVIYPEQERVHGDADLTEARLAELLKGAAGWIIGQALVTRELLQQCPELLVLSRRGVGYDRVDAPAVANLGKVLTIATGGNDEAVADHTMALMLGVSRRLRELQQRMSGGTWSLVIGSDLFRKTVGIVGFGRIARALVRRLSGFECTILVSAGPHHADAIRAAGARPAALDVLLAESDVLTLHAPFTAATRFMIDRAAIARMKRSAVLINTARGGLVQDGDLLDALREGRLAGAGLDVFLSEIDPAFRDVTEALVALPNVVATPHAAASSREGLEKMNRISAENVVAVLDGGAPPPARVVVDGR